MKKRCFLLLCIALFSASSLFAQTGQLRGILIDSAQKKQGELILLSLSGLDTIVFANSEGQFAFNRVPAGKHVLKISCPGSQHYQQQVTILAGQTTTLRINYPPPCAYDAHRKDARCPVCHRKDHVQKIIYGLPIGEMDTVRYRYAGCEVTGCDPGWYCRRDKLSF